VDIVEKLYKTFSKYQLNEKSEKCLCGCISEEAERKIYSKNLRELEAADIGFYSNKAMTTWGNEENYKHFLPRIIEIYKEDKANAWIGLESIHNKLKHANWKKWDEIEQKQIIEFVANDWKELINQSKKVVWNIYFEPYLHYFDFQELLEMWKFPENKIALHNFVEFFFSVGNDIVYSERKVKIGEKDRRNELLNLIERDNLTSSLEEEYFENETSNEAYADKISVVLQMIENKIKE
jgi:hypothetical protein